MMRGWYGPPPPPPRASAGGSLATLVAITTLVALAAPHAQALRPQVQAARAILAGNLPDLPALPTPKLQLPRISRPRLPAPPSARSGRTSPRPGRAVSYALAQRGKLYRWGAEGPESFDCSGLTWAAWRSAGVSIPRTAEGQRVGLPPATGRLRPGDLVIYRTTGPSRRHVAMVVGPGRMAEARNRATGVVTGPLRAGWLRAVRPGGGG
jgi:cell wall-associated NlpC family hydrolase